MAREDLGSEEGLKYLTRGMGERLAPGCWDIFVVLGKGL